MFNCRVGTRTNIYSEVARVDGPELDVRPLNTAPGPAVQWGSFRAEAWEQEFDISKWYAQYRLPTVCKDARRYCCPSPCLHFWMA